MIFFLGFCKNAIQQEQTIGALNIGVSLFGNKRELREHEDYSMRDDAVVLRHLSYSTDLSILVCMV